MWGESQGAQEAVIEKSNNYKIKAPLKLFFIFVKTVYSWLFC